ncbi:MAG: hypothetical protein H7Z42_23445 [Roseiflexaceae bacterium]|nr:hypothetical protein [Roseiflexaceae bacterium]
MPKRAEARCSRSTRFSAFRIPAAGFSPLEMMMPPRRPKSPDIEEITPSHFLVHNDNAFSVLRGEGERRGKLFELTTWRREGLLGRLELRGYTVLTLDKRIEALPAMPQPLPLGESGWRLQSGEAERLSVFDLASRQWQLVVFERGELGVGATVQAGQVLRRRKGRGAASYGLAVSERAGTIGTQTLTETPALLLGHAQSPPLALRPHHEGEMVLLPVLLLPTPYREFLHRVAEETPLGWRIPPVGLPFATRALAQLGLTLEQL